MLDDLLVSLFNAPPRSLPVSVAMQRGLPPAKKGGLHRPPPTEQEGVQARRKATNKTIENQRMNREMNGEFMDLI